MADFEDMEVRRVKLEKLSPAEYNPRKMRDEARQGLGVSIGKFGMLLPIVWNKRSGNIVGGHRRYEHLKATGETEVDVVVVDLSYEDEVALNISLNSKKIRGDFTSEIVKMLEMSEAQIGNEFNELGLNDLHNYVKSLKFELKNASGQNDRKSEKGSGSGDSPSRPPPSGPNAVIACPRCKSRWKMSDNKVVYNAVGASARGESDDDSE